MLDYVAVNKEWIFAGVGFSVVAAIIFVVRFILNRHRSDGSISTRPFPAEIVRDIGKRPPVRRILPFLSIGYLIYALLIAWFICRLLFRVYRVQSAGQMHLAGGIRWMPLAMTSFFAFAFIGICLCLALFLSARRWRSGALVLACISCISIPIGTILGGLTIYALTRPEVKSEFTQNDLTKRSR
jgi:preprotein translocase subunit SecG